MTDRGSIGVHVSSIAAYDTPPVRATGRQQRQRTHTAGQSRAPGSRATGAE